MRRIRQLPSAPSACYGEELLELASHGKVKLPEIPPDPNLWRTLKPAKLKTKGQAASDLLRRIMELEEGYAVKMKDGSMHELKVSEIPTGTRIKVYYITKTKKDASGAKTKFNQIIKIRFLPKEG